jgi:hypothetical protein
MSWAVPARKSDNGIVANLTRVRCATDGDMDIALALLMAHYQWEVAKGGTVYLDKAKAKIQDLNNNLVYGGHPKIYWLKIADGISDAQKDDGTPVDKLALVTRSSDFLISHCRVFYKIDPTAYLLKYAADDMTTILDTFRLDWSAVGLVSDFLDINPDCYYQKTSPKPGHFAPAWAYDAWMITLDETGTSAYNYNACRVPMRLALSYRFGETYIKDYLSASGTPRGFVDWLWKDVAKVATNTEWYKLIKDGIKMNGTFVGSETNNAFIAPFVAGCIIDSKYQTELDAGWNYIKNISTKIYYEDTLTLLSMLVASGYWWMPQ